MDARLPLQAAILFSVAAHVLGMMLLSATKLTPPHQHSALTTKLEQRPIYVLSLQQTPVISPRSAPAHLLPLPLTKLSVEPKRLTAVLHSNSRITEQLAMTEKSLPSLITPVNSATAPTVINQPAPIPPPDNSAIRHNYWSVNNHAPAVDQQALYQAHQQQQAMHFMLSESHDMISRYQAQLSGVLNTVKLNADCQLTVKAQPQLRSELSCEDEQDIDLIKTAVANAGTYPTLPGSIELSIHFAPQPKGGVEVNWRTARAEQM